MTSFKSHLPVCGAHLEALQGKRLLQRLDNATCIHSYIGAVRARGRTYIHIAEPETPDLFDDDLISVPYLRYIL